MLPNTGMSFTPFDPLPASDLNDLVENIESLNTGVGIADDAIIKRHIADGQINAPLFEAGATSLGYSSDAGATLTNAYVTRTSVTATSKGGRVKILVGGFFTNGNSGAVRTVDMQLLCDGALVKAITGLTASYLASNNPTLNFNYQFSHTPSAASHTWALQMKASISSAVVLTDNYMEVVEVR